MKLLKRLNSKLRNNLFICTTRSLYNEFSDKIEMVNILGVELNGKNSLKVLLSDKNYLILENKGEGYKNYARKGKFTNLSEMCELKLIDYIENVISNNTSIFP